MERPTRERRGRPTARAILGLAATTGLVLAGGGCVGSLDEEERARFGIFPDAGDGAEVGVDTGVDPCPDVVSTILASAQTPNGCAQSGCHSAAASSQGLDLESPDLVDRLVGQPAANCPSVPYIDPDNPAMSLIVQKMGPAPYPCGGSPMPIGGTLTSRDVECVVAYIESELGGGMDAGVPDTGTPDTGAGMDTGVEPDAGMMGPVVFEAEAMALEPPFEVASDPGASGGEYVARPVGPLNDDPDATGVGRATYDFTVPTAGDARVFLRVRAAGFENDAFWVRIDDLPWVRYNGWFEDSQGAWAWDDVHDDLVDAGVPVLFPLSAGAHTLEVKFRQENAQLDRVIITQDPGFMPPAD